MTCLKHVYLCMYIEDETKPKLLLAQKDVLLAMRVNTIGKDVFEQIPLPSQIKNINALVYNPINGTLIISEGYSRKIMECSTKTMVCTVLIENGIVNVTSMDLGKLNLCTLYILLLHSYHVICLLQNYSDVISENLIWLDSGKRTIEVMSLRTHAKTVALRNVENAHDITFAPDSL